VNRDDLVTLHVALHFESETVLARPLFRAFRHRIDLRFLGGIFLALDQAARLRPFRDSLGGGRRGGRRLCDGVGRDGQHCRGQGANHGSDHQLFHGENLSI
jgi:hypothetical protein